MSYILDALRRSEEERNRGHVPTLKTVYYDQDGGSLDFLHTTMGRLLVLALLLALAALLYSNRQPLLGAVERLTGGGDTAVESAEVAQIGSTSNAAPSIQQPVQQQSVQQQSVQQQAVQQQPVQQQSNQPAVSVAAQTRQAESQPTQPIPAQPAPQSQSLQPQAADQVALATAPANADTTQSPPPQNSDVKTKHDLPPEVMRSVPKLAISVVSYAADPKKRFVMVDSEIYYEGEEMTQNLIIESITSDGPIVTWRGHEFLMQP